MYLVLAVRVLDDLNVSCSLFQPYRIARCVPNAFVADVARGAYRLHQIDEDQLVRASQLEAQYDSLSLGFVDAAVIATCERLGETKVATLDRRHFAIVRPSHCAALSLLPPD